MGDKLSRHLSEEIGQTNGVCVCNTHHLSVVRVVAMCIFFSFALKGFLDA